MPQTSPYRSHLPVAIHLSPSRYDNWQKVSWWDWRKVHECCLPLHRGFLPKSQIFFGFILLFRWGFLSYRSRGFLYRLHSLFVEVQCLRYLSCWAWWEQKSKQHWRRWAKEEAQRNLKSQISWTCRISVQHLSRQYRTGKNRTLWCWW